MVLQQLAQSRQSVLAHASSLASSFIRLTCLTGFFSIRVRKFLNLFLFLETRFLKVRKLTVDWVMELIDFGDKVCVNILILKMNTYFFHERSRIQTFADTRFYFIIKIKFFILYLSLKMIIGDRRVHRF